MKKNCEKCGWDAFEVEIRDADTNTYLRCTKCGYLHKVEAKAKAEITVSKPAAKAVDAISRDFDADKALLMSRWTSKNPLEFPR